MKSVLTLVMILACASALSAGELESIKRTAAFENYNIDIKTALASASLTTPSPAVTWPEEDFTLRREFCWTRGKDANAERLGMTYSFCINSLKITAGINDDPKLKMKGDVLNGLFDLKISPPGDGLYRATAVIFKREPMIQVCAPAETAYIELNLLIDERGKIVADPETKSFYGATENTCGSPWNYREIRYAMTAEMGSRGRAAEASLLGPVVRWPAGTIDIYSHHAGGDVGGRIALLPFYQYLFLHVGTQIIKMQGSKKICDDRDGLPTIKQLALAYNPKGVSDKPLAGYKEIRPRGEDPFYYDKSAYQRPPGDIGSGDERGFWYVSKSVTHCGPDPDNLEPERCSVFSFGAYTGGIMWDDPDNARAVRCMR